MQVTVGKIEELARHFRGEGGASLPPPYGIYLGREPRKISNDVGSLRVAVVF